MKSIRILSRTWRIHCRSSGPPKPFTPGSRSSTLHDQNSNAASADHRTSISSLTPRLNFGASNINY
jgi:hypothetical protein